MNGPGPRKAEKRREESCMGLHEGHCRAERRVAWYGGQCGEERRKACGVEAQGCWLPVVD